MWETRVKRFVKVGYGRWVDPFQVQGVEPTSAGKVRIRLSCGGSVDVPIPGGEGVDSFTDGVLRKLLADPNRAEAD